MADKKDANYVYWGQRLDEVFPKDDVKAKKPPVVSKKEKISDTVFKCKMCGNEIDSDKLGTNNVCGKCGARYALKPVKKEIADLYDRADALRRDCEFDSAESIYRDIISIDEKQADAYWGAVLCKYCVGCINDRDTHTRISICRGSSADSIKSDDDFLLAVEYGDDEQKSVYNSEADEIIRTQKEIFEIMSSEKPFDVFISYKETDANGKRTKDSDSAEAMYNLLVRNGLKVFYAPVTLRGENKMGRKYLTSIFAAVNSAKVMLAVGSKPEYLSAEWVKSEWSRFLELMKIDNSKILLPCFLDMKAGDLPKGLKQLQAEDITSRANEVKTANKVIDYLHPQNNLNPTVTALKKRGFMALEVKDWKKADEFFESALNYDAENGECYLGKLMAERAVCRKEDLLNCAQPFSGSRNFELACRFDEQIKKLLNYYNQTIIERNEENRKNKKYNDALCKFNSAKTESDCEAAAKLFNNIYSYKDSAKKVEECKEKANEIIYNTALRKLNYASKKSDCEAAAYLFGRIKFYNDSFDRITECKKKAEVLELEAVLRRKYEEDCRKDKIYSDAIHLIEKPVYFSSKNNTDRKVPSISDYEKAIEKLKTISDWKDSDNVIEAYRKKIVEIRDKEAENKKKEEKEKERIARKAAIWLIVFIIGTIFLFIVLDAFLPNNKGENSSGLSGYNDSSDENTSLEIGDNIFIGVFEQDNDFTNGSEPIEWIVLDKNEKSVLLISKYAIDFTVSNSYNFLYGNTWDKCVLRYWLNEPFFKNSFNDAEKNNIISTKLTAYKNSSYNTNPGENTEDKIFLLSEGEVKRYFNKKNDLNCISTKTAISKGAKKNCSWLLRTPGHDENSVMCVNSDDSINYYGISFLDKCGVRPAMWVSTE